MVYQHTPVMLREAIEYLNPKFGDIIVDCTLGGGGYTLEIAKRVGEKGKVIAIDADEMAVTNAKGKIKNAKLGNIILAHENFKELQKIVNQAGLEKVNGIVFDLGLSSAQLQDQNRGFSFKLDAPLNMSFGSEKLEVKSKKTEDIINKYKQEELEKIIKDYCEERYAGRIAAAIVKNRPLKTTKELAEAIANAVPVAYSSRWSYGEAGRRGRINPATRTFQALRIATNDELNALQTALSQAIKVLAAGGRLAVVSYHSLEDRIVKHFFKQEARGCVCPPEVLRCVCGHKPELKILTKKIVAASAEEIKTNPRARSAKLRAAEKI